MNTYGTVDSALFQQTLETSMAAGLTVAIIWLVVLIGLGIILGTLTKKLARKKGYRGYFWTGFFLNWIGLIYVVGLPVKSKRRRYEEDED